MSTTTGSRSSKKRKEATDVANAPKAPKKRRSQGPEPTKSPLIGPHESIIFELQPKYDILVASVISSTQIRKRISQATEHVGAPSEKPRIVLFHARPAEVCKLVTIVEHCKRVLSDQGRVWFQYNELFEMPPGTGRSKKTADTVEETVLDKDGDEGDSEEGEFETMKNTRFEKATMAAPPRTMKSLRVFFTTESVPELRSKKGVTLQSAES
ncbi:hypothetical protein JDV02_006764 [Purpureocillium takamizusanense]|uniref:DNA/RNA-binding protein Alba-like domain-containing protein n=1 Tax=Purpureocillium takamizusanense TaxID=2060973 RepID=A0A9Q8QIZ5_9HYPO|nr:uncharacterized protein JDV02_006764 [Purpureocillium takamizusanense]UNI20698.1 hypothetical protein JDV02_006764 [Purpureocillium takamizusanense]